MRSEDWWTLIIPLRDMVRAWWQRLVRSRVRLYARLPRGGASRSILGLTTRRLALLGKLHLSR
jgi:hypothetical protein